MLTLVPRGIQKKLFIYGIIPSLCYGICFSQFLQADDPYSRKNSLVILQERIHGKTSEGINFQQKIQFLTALANERAEKISSLQEEINNLQRKLHLTQLTMFSEDTGNYKQLYSNLKREFIQNQQKQNQLENIISDLKEAQEAEKLKIVEAQAHIASLITALETHAFALERNDERHKQELIHLATAHSDVSSYKMLYEALELELAQSKETQKQLEQWLEQLKKNENLNQKKILDAEIQMSFLMDALQSQTLASEKWLENLKDQFNSADSERHSILSSQEEKISKYENDLHKYQTALSQLQERFISQENALNSQDDDLAVLHEKLLRELNVNQAYLQNLYETMEVEEIKNFLKLQEEQQNFLKKLEELSSTYELSSMHTDGQTLAQLINLYTALEDENSLALLSKRDYNQILWTLDENLKKAYENLDRLKNDQNLQVIHLYNVFEAEDGLMDALYKQTIEKENDLAEALETAYEQHRLLLGKAEKDEDEIRQLLSEFHEERQRTQGIQKNLAEVQQMYDQTVKLYNEMYIDHKSTQKQLESYQQEMSDQKLNHLVAMDSLEMKIEELTQKLEKQQHQNQELQSQLAAALEQTALLKILQGQHQQLTQESTEIQQSYTNLLDTLSTKESLLEQTQEEMKQKQQILEEIADILIQVQQEKKALALQLLTLPLSPDEMEQLQTNYDNVKNELASLKSTHFHHLHQQSLHEELVNQAQKELEQHKSLIAEKEQSIQELLKEKDALNTLLIGKNEDIDLLQSQMDIAEERIKAELQEAIKNLEIEKNKNNTLQAALTDHKAMVHSTHYDLQENLQELEKLKNSLDVKEQHILVQKSEIENLAERLQKLDHEKSQVELKLQSLEDTNLAEINKRNQEISLLKEQMEKQKKLYSVHENDKVMVIQLERLQEALQQMISEKTQLQSQFQNQLVTENTLKERLEKANDELREYKAAFETLKMNSEP